MRKNLFDFATKELSQDAFLSWFIANCNDEEIGKESYRFINFLTGLSLKYGDIKDIQVLQQEHDIDIVVDFWLKEKRAPESHYVMIIEDKTASSAHDNQLKRYAKILESWNTDQPGYEQRRFKVFYKVNYLTDEDKQEIELANKDCKESDKWKEYDINKIYSFFKSIEESKSEILNSYAEYIRKLHESFTEESKEPMINWNYANFETFFKSFERKVQSIHSDSHFESWRYQGRLVSCAFYYHPKNNRFEKDIDAEHKDCKAYPLIEFVFRRGGEKLVINTHITFHWNDYWGWKPYNYKPNVNEAKTFVNELREALKSNSNLKGIKVRKMSSERYQTISVDELSIKDKTNDVIKKEIQSILDVYFKVFKSIDK